MGVAVYYFTYVCGNANMLSAFMISASIAEVVGLIIFPEVAKEIIQTYIIFTGLYLTVYWLSIIISRWICMPTEYRINSSCRSDRKDRNRIRTWMCDSIPCRCCWLWWVCSWNEKWRSGILFTDTDRKLTAAFTSLAMDLYWNLPDMYRMQYSRWQHRILSVYWCVSYRQSESFWHTSYIRTNIN